MAKIKNIFSGIGSFIWSHRILSLIILIIIAVSPFAINYFSPKKTTVSYVTQAVKNGNISISVSGTGQVSSSKQIDLTSEVSGTVTGEYVKVGETVNKGDLLFKINSTDAAQKVKNAQLSLESAELALEDLKSPADELTLVQSENALISAQQTKTDAETNLEKAYEDGFNSTSNAFLDLPSIMTGLNNILFSDNLSLNGSQENIDYYAASASYYNDKGGQYKEDAYNKYLAAKQAYEKSIADYKATSRFSDKAAIEALIAETYDTTKSIAEAIKSADNLIELYEYSLSNKQLSYNSIADTHLSSLNNYTSKINSHLSSLFSAKNTINQDKDSIVSADRSIKEKELSLQKVKDGATDLEIKAKELSIEQQKQSLAEAQTTLSKYSIRAPFSGIISSVGVDVGDSANSGTALGSIITSKMIATITLNEVDIAKVKVGQKVELTFDALDNQVIEGEVAEVDAIGTVSQGVVSYSVKISFDTDNESVKPGMSISAGIVSESVSNVLVIPSSAVKTMGGKSIVEVMNSDGKIEKKTVEVGITDDTSIEIKSGLALGDKVVTGTSTKTTTKTTTTKTTTTTNQGGPGGAGDMMMLTR